MTTKTFTAEQIKEVIGNTPPSLPYVSEDVQKLRWAATEYLRARDLLEWYGDKNNHTIRYGSDPATAIKMDKGQRARDWLGVSNNGT